MVVSVKLVFSLKLRAVVLLCASGGAPSTVRALSS